MEPTGAGQMAERVVAPSAGAAADTFLGWDQLILLATPFPIMFTAEAAYVLGLDGNAADSIRALYLAPAFLLSFTSGFGLPIMLVIGLLFLIGRNIYLRRVRRLALYAVVLIILPVTTRLADSDYLRFVLQEPKFEAQLAHDGAAMPGHSARCFVFDHVQDNFYLGGASFDPFEKWILYVSEDLAGEETPRIDSFSPDDRCGAPDLVAHIRRLTGRFYLATTSRF
jgi:hypothetical protein